MKNEEPTERMLLTGVYSIVHLRSGKIYVGSASVSFRKRIGEHRFELLKGSHHSILLQRAWNKYGAGSFEFRILRVTEPSDAVAFEQAFIDFHKAADSKFGYNLAPLAGTMLGFKHSVEACAKMSASQRGKKRSPEAIEKTAAALRGRKLGPEALANMSAAQQGKTHSMEARAKISAAFRGKRLTQEHCAKISDAQRGRVVTPETRAKISTTLLGRRLSKEHCAKLSSVLRGRVRTPEHRANMSASQQGKGPGADAHAKTAATKLRKKLAKASALLVVIT